MTSADHSDENRATYDPIAELYLERQLDHRATGDDLFGPSSQPSLDT